MEEQNTQTTINESVTHTLEAIGGALVITITGVDTLPPGTMLSFNIVTPDAREGGVSGETEEAA